MIDTLLGRQLAFTDVSLATILMPTLLLHLRPSPVCFFANIFHPPDHIHSSIHPAVTSLSINIGRGGYLVEVVLF